MTSWKDFKAASPLRGEARVAYETARGDMGVGYLILQARSAAGLTQAQLANRIGTSQPTIARWEAGSQIPSVRSLIRLAEATGFELRVGLHDGRSRDRTVVVRSAASG
ncbi:MAG: helix-turn-helix transcriptional regulator [Actinomycetota bacterium]